jgi:shikimate dehydrogenase
MHQAAFMALGMEHEWSYQRLPVPPELFEETVRGLPEAGFAGANVTIPHKEAALALADEATPEARAIGASNTLSFGADGLIRAANTDAPGLIAALPEPAFGRSAFVLGAGGSARAVAWALRDAGASEVSVWNRTPERARALADALGVRAAERLEPADLLVNCTSVGLREGPSELKIGPLDADGLLGFNSVIDLVYGTRETALVRAAGRLGLPVVDGLEVLVRQGAASFELWTGRTPPLDAMRAGARDP